MISKSSSISSYLELNPKIELMFFTETWLKKDIPDTTICPKDYSAIRVDRVGQNGGGVAVVYQNHLQVVEITTIFNDLQPYLNNFEYLCIDLFINPSSCMRFLCFYIRPAFSKCQLTIKAVCTVIDRLCLPQKPCIIIGDFNLPNINWDIPTAHGDLSHQIFLDFCSSSNLTQCIRDPTHDKQNILDLVLCNDAAYKILNSHMVKPPMLLKCDHNILSLIFDSLSLKRPSRVPEFPCYTKGNYVDMCEELLNINWEPVTNVYNFNVQSYYDDFILNLQNLINKYVPKCRSVSNTKRMPKHIKILLKEKIRTYRRCKENKNLKSKYKEICKQYENAVRAWNDRNESRLCKNPTSKKFYGYINRKLGHKQTLPPLYDDTNDTLCLSDDDKARLLNANFQKVFVEDDGKLPANSQTNPNLWMDNISISRQDIKKALKKMTAKISRTPENVPSYVLKKIGHCIIRPLEIIFNNSLCTAQVIKQWKVSYIIPVHKKGSRKDPKNYRPIALTSSFSRLLESILHTKISNYMIENSLLSDSQYGFLANRSSCSQLLSSVHDWIWSYINNQSVDVVYLDIAKAFDTVSHVKLIKSLQSYGISHNVVMWIKEFLNNRTQQVCIGTSTSTPLQVISGVPQGGVIGPLLFVIYINSLCAIVNSTADCTTIKLFADDAKIYGKNKTSVQQTLNTTLSWINDHQLKVATQKCFYLNICKKRLKPQQPDQTKYRISSDNLTIENTTRDLGITISDDMKWSHQVDNVYKRASTTSYLVMKCLSTKNIWILVNLYKTYVRPKMEFNTNVWSPYLLKDINRIESIQRKFTKSAFIRCNVPFESYQDRLSKINLKTLEERRLVFDMITTYKIVHRLSDLNFEQYFTFVNQTYQLRRHTLQIKCIKDNNSKFWVNSFFHRVVNVWNWLPNQVVTAKNIATFRNMINEVSFSKFLKFREC